MKGKRNAENNFSVSARTHVVHDLGRAEDAFKATPHPTNRHASTCQSIYQIDGSYGCNEEWAGEKNLAAMAATVHKGGRPESAAAVAKAMEALGSLPGLQSIRSTLRYGEEGDSVDAVRLIERLPDFWTYQHRKVSMTGRPTHIRIVVNVAASAGVDAADLVWRGAAAAVLTDRLEEAGYRVQMDMIWQGNDIGGDRPKETSVLLWRVKDFEEVCDVGHIAAMTATPAALRILGFAGAYAALPNCQGGLGYCVNTRPDPILAEEDVYIDNVFNLAQALAVCRDAVAVIESGTMNTPEGEEQEI